MTKLNRDPTVSNTSCHDGHHFPRRPHRQLDMGAPSVMEIGNRDEATAYGPSRLPPGSWSDLFDRIMETGWTW